MKYYQIVENFDTNMHAGSKANNDVVAILKRSHFEAVPIMIAGRKTDFFSKIKRQWKFYQDWKAAYHQIEAGATLFIQHPSKIRQLGRRQTLVKLKREKQVKFIYLVHDIETLRFPNEGYQREFEEMLVFADRIIAHNDSMKTWLVDQGVPEKKVVCLRIFDYLNEKPTAETISFSKVVTIAGNLAKEKSPYVYQLDKLPQISFELLGIAYEPTTIPNNVAYRGAFPPDDVPHQINHGFGLVWDGGSIDTCQGETGEYLRYNNPHKLSLYLSSGLPVIVWSESAEASFVLEHGVGLTVNSLYDLETRLQTISESDYQKMVQNVKQVMTKLKAGDYLSDAITRCLQGLEV